MVPFTELTVWGVVAAGTRVTRIDTGESYIVGKMNDEGFTGLRNISGGTNTAFESMDEVDHSRWRAS